MKESAVVVNPALKTLIFVLKSQPELAAGKSKTLFLRALADPELKDVALPGLICNQTFRPAVEELEAQGFMNTLEPQGTYDLILYLGTGQRDENLYNFARAASMLNRGGLFMCAMHNDIGAGRFEKRLRELFGATESFSKNHCRVFRARASEAVSRDLMLAWLDLGAIRPVENTGMVSRPGQFGWNKLDRGTDLLCQNLPQTLSGEGADLGSGFGHISAHLLSHVSGIRTLHIYEAEHLALEVCRLNLKNLCPNIVVTFNWHDVQSGLLHKNLDWIVMNPPFHAGGKTLPELGKRFIEAAADALRPGGALYMVANNHLPYRETLRMCFSGIDSAVEKNGFIVYSAHR